MSQYHFIGIGGIGMSALAHILLDQGKQVSGSDAHTSFLLDALKNKGAKIISHEENLDENVSKVIFSTAISKKHQGMEAARKRGILLLHRSELLHELMQESLPLLVAGTHGKTTTTSLLSFTLFHAGLDPSFAVGGIVKGLQKNRRFGKGKYFVAEADESDGSFCCFSPWGGIVTNIDDDHLDFWGTSQALQEGFRNYLAMHASKEHLFWCKDDENLQKLNPEGISYGFSEDAMLKVCNFLQLGWQLHFDIRFEGKEYENITIPLIGGHNVLNAAAVFGLCLKLGISEESIRKAFLAFEGVERRAEYKGECKKTVFYDDYAHHPTEIFATLQAVKNAYPKKRLIVAFQPHRYTRTRDCLEDFKEAFHAADVLLISDIYSAGEKPLEGINGEFLCKTVAEHFKGYLYYIPRAEMASFISELLLEEDVVVTMGAGDITFLSKEIIDKSNEH